MIRVLKGLLIPSLILVSWEYAARTEYFTTTSLSSPAQIGVATWSLLVDGSLAHAAFETFVSATGGVALGSTCGVLAGIALGLSRFLAAVTRLSIESLRPLPSVALIPLALIIFGYGYRMEVAVVAFACFWPVMIFTERATRSIDPRLIEVAQTLRLSLLHRTMKIILPSALPRIFVGLRVATTIALVVAVTVEITTNPIGLGYGLVIAQQSDRADQVFAYLCWIGFFGWALNALLFQVQRRLFVQHSA